VISVVAVAAILAAGLTACQVKVGAAAFVGTTKIGESTVQTYLTPSATSVQQQDPSTGQTSTLNPKTLVLSSLITQDLFSRALAASPEGPPTSAELSVAHNDVVQQLLQGSDEATFAKGIAQYGFKASFAPLYVHANELEDVLGRRLKAQSATDLTKAIAALHLQVDVSPRYGSWDASQLSIGGASTDYLKSVPLIANG
jgi:hypothetical protein